jgi:uncharacterized protein YodC (DUF2158 family)
MAASFKVAQNVKLVATVPTGEVKQLSVDQEGNIQYLVEWTNADGTVHQTWFKEDSLVAV